ncbi:MAG TPA: TonB family protein [Blastocatellia bacterium]|nr:TonB family protein [Blastocatellia bacterium]
MDVTLRGLDRREVALFSVADAGIEPLKSGSGGEKAYVVLENGSSVTVPILRADSGMLGVSSVGSAVPDADSWGRPAFDAKGDVVGIYTSNSHVTALSSLVALRYALPVAGDASPPPPPTETDSKDRIVGGVPGGILGTVPGDNQNPNAPRVVRKSVSVLKGDAIRRAEPLYPPLAKAARLTGSVPVEIIIDEEGEVMVARALGGHPLLKNAAVAAAQAFRFTPTLVEGTPVKVVGTITFNFSF